MVDNGGIWNEQSFKDFEAARDAAESRMDAANFRLQQAAPQMLEALEAMIKRFQPESHDAAGCMFKNCELCKAIAAIAAAKGEV